MQVAERFGLEYMKMSRTKFVILFLAIGFAFLFFSTGVLNLPPESFLGSESQVAWKSTVSTILSPIKIVLIGPLLPFIRFLRQDPDTPPPFFIAMFAVYWSVLATVFHYSLNRKVQ
jgi:hypothetical protein